MIRWNSRTGRWSDELPSRLCSFVSSGLLAGGAAVRLPGAWTYDGFTAGVGTGLTATRTLGINIPAGSLVIVLTCNGATPPATGCSDSQGNTYTLDVVLRESGNSGAGGAIMSSVIATALSIGDVITVAIGGSTSSKGVAVGYYNNPTNSTPFDKSSTGQSTSSSTPSSGNTAATTQARELVVGMLSTQPQSATHTQAGTYTSIVLSQTVQSLSRFTAGYKIVTATGAQAYAPGMSGAAAYACMIATYKVDA